LTFALEPWETHDKRITRALDQQAMFMQSRAPTLFDNVRRRNAMARSDAAARLQLRYVADPATRRAALWLVLQVIWYIPDPRPRLALRLGDTSQDQFYGSVGHAGWDWLPRQALAWPAPYRKRHWHGFTDASDALKGTVDINEGTN
jgi:hypothetical protein